MRKRFISGLTAVCIVGILITNMITSASAVISAAVVGASVAGSLLLGTLFNQMCGGQGYDFTNAFQDAVKLYTDWEEDFDGSAKDPIHPVTKVEIDTSKVNIPDNVNFNSVGGTSADKMLIEMQKAINEGLEDGSIEINFDEDGNISMPTASYCTAVSDIYEKFGVFTNKNGLNRVRTYWTLVSDSIETTFDGWNISFNPYSYADTSSKLCFLFPYCVQNEQLIFLNYNFRVGYRDVTCVYGTSYNYVNGMYSEKAVIERDKSLFPNWDDFYQSVSISINNLLFYGDFNASAPGSGIDSVAFTVPESAQYGIGGIEIDNSKLQYTGFALVTNGRTGFENFVATAKAGAIENKRNDVSIPLTGVENTIGNMGLAGVGSGTAKGTVSVNSKTKDITVTNEATKEAELVIEQGNAGDIDTPDVDSITDKFPFSLPFDIYNLVTIFVRDEQKPIFEIPIQTTLDIAGEDYKVDEKIVLDLTQFQLNGVDIIRVFTRTVTYVAFIAFLIKITPHVIKH